MFMVDGKTDEEAALILRNLWIFSNAKAIEAWDQQRVAENEERQLLLGMLDRHRRTPFFLLLGWAILTKRLTSSQ